VLWIVDGQRLSLVVAQKWVCTAKTPYAHVSSVQLEGLWMTWCLSPLLHKQSTWSSPRDSQPTFRLLRVLDPADDAGDLVERFFVFTHEALGLVDGVDHGGVVAATEEARDGWVTQLGHVAEHVHGDLASRDQWSLAGLALQGFHRESEVSSHLSEHFLVGAVLWSSCGEKVGQLLLGHGHGGWLTGEVGIGGDSDESAFQLTDVRSDVRGNELQNVGGKRGVVPICLISKDCEPGFEVRRLNIGDEAPAEAATEAIFEGGDGIWHPVGGNNDLLIGPVEAVEGVEKLLLEPFFSFHELNVIDEQNVDVAVAALEGCGGVCTNRVDIFVQECFS